MSGRTDNPAIATMLDRLTARVTALDDGHRQVVNTQTTVKRKLDELARKVDALDNARREAGNLRAAFAGRIDALAKTVDGQSSAHDRLRADLGDVVERLRQDGQDDIGRLTARIGWIERRVRLDQDLHPVDLDAVDGWDDLVAPIRRARDHELSLLTAARLAHHEATIDAYRAHEKTAVALLAQATAASATIAHTRIGSDEHRAAAREYRGLRQELVTVGQRLTATAAAFTEARQAVSQHVSQGELHGPQLDAGHAARRDLHARLRNRVVAAVEDASLLPLWFTTVLRHQPPATSAERWYALAADVLLFRVTYAVTDRAVALGVEPASHDDSHRAVRHRDISRAVDELWGGTR